MMHKNDAQNDAQNAHGQKWFTFHVSESLGGVLRAQLRNDVLQTVRKGLGVTDLAADDLRVPKQTE